MALSWGKRVDAAFVQRVYELCDALKWPRETHASWLMGCMAFESAETFRADILNGAGSGAVGLIQFMPSTARELGTTAEALGKMTPCMQLAYVQRYFRPYASRVKTLADMYMAILMPKYVGTPDDTVIFTSGTVAYRQNSGFDRYKDGKITKLEVSRMVIEKHERGLLPEFAL